MKFMLMEFVWSMSEFKLLGCVIVQRWCSSIRQEVYEPIFCNLCGGWCSELFVEVCV